ncbi:MAG: cyclic nucleotide-binding domain-containing protein [Myxococcota bacterium]
MAAKVLIAHGDTHSLERAVRDLTVAGFEVVATPDGGDAFARFFEVQPDVVICSENLPVLDGRSFGNMIRSQAPSVPVVLLVTEESAAAAADADADDGGGGGGAGFLILPDPLDVHALLAVVPGVEPESPAPHDEPGPAPPSPVEPETASKLHETLRKFQREGNLLALLDDPGMERLASLAELQDRDPDDRVIREGDAFDGFYLVVEGAVRVTLAERGDEEVARLGDGEFFGEMAMLSEQPRSASVWTCGPTKLLFFERDAVLVLLDDYPGLREVLGGVALQRAEENLFQALSGDDGVQTSLSELLEGIEETDDTEKARQDEAGAAPGRVEKPRRPTLPTRPELASMVSGGKMELRMWWQTARLFSLRHQFESGLILGAIGGMAIMATMMALFTDRAPESRVAVMPDAGVTPTKAGSAGDEVPDEPTDGDEPAEKAAAGGKETIGGVRGERGGESKPVLKGQADEKPGADEAGSASETDRPRGPPSQRRKALRKRFFELYEERSFVSAAGAGKMMQRHFDLDWEAEFTLAQAQRRAGYKAAALTSYLAFAEKHPKNVYADDAQFYAAEILVSGGKNERAVELYRAIIVNPKTNLKARAEKALAKVQP